MYRFLSILFMGCTFLMIACSSSDESTPMREKKDKKASGPAKIIAKVEFSSLGCFHHRKSKLLILQKGEQSYVRIENDGKTPFEKELGNSQMVAFREFIRQLKNLRNSDSYCTTVDSYNVTYQSETINKDDASCAWKGYQALCNELFNSDYLSAFN
ncbi:MAG: hypothetical protein JNK14_12275 [Chitinophagaceae bacterium]|nr:hypothetical protein [Chitinophagaceae bacterium]